MYLYTLIASIGLLTMVQVNGASLNQSESVEKSILSASQQSQKTISSSADLTIEHQNEIKSLQESISQLSVYQKHLNALLASQESELASLDSQLNELGETKQSVVPLMYKMLEQLDTYIENDLPLHKATRTERVNKLKALMVRADIADAEKYRRIMEAYQIELDYVSKLSTYLGPITVNNIEKQAEILHLGHLSIIARSLDKQTYWVWNNTNKQWENRIENTQQLDHAYSVANQQVPPALLALPLSIAEVTQ
ncbi:DUF3450 domain-containing protein [Psychromonas sp. KJ10-10]|uniref:DUF3450 domain-containing protein n=1 Tax=Psychromonas sp. KJ10-10 TaxID=3391823 RepID=UPI0039B49EBF